MSWLSVEHAAEALDLSPEALRKALERRARKRSDGVIVSEMDGIEARKLGRQWRVRLGSWETAALEVASNCRENAEKPGKVRQ
jgi:hypothetical protein